MAVRMDDTEVPIVRELGGEDCKVSEGLWPPRVGDALLEDGERIAVTEVTVLGHWDGRDRVRAHLADGRHIDSWRRYAGQTKHETFGFPLARGDWLVTFEGSTRDERWRVSKADVHERAGREIYERSNQGQRVFPDSPEAERARLERAAIAVAREARGAA